MSPAAWSEDKRLFSQATILRKKNPALLFIIFLCRRFPYFLKCRAVYRNLFPLYLLYHLLLIRASRRSSYLQSPDPCSLGKLALKVTCQRWRKSNKLICFVTRERMVGKTWTMTRRKVLRYPVVHHSLLLQTTSVRHLLFKPTEKNPAVCAKISMTVNYVKNGV